MIQNLIRFSVNSIKVLKKGEIAKCYYRLMSSNCSTGTKGQWLIFDILIFFIFHLCGISQGFRGILSDFFLLLFTK